MLPLKILSLFNVLTRTKNNFYTFFYRCKYSAFLSGKHVTIRKGFIIEPFGQIRVILGEGVVIKEFVIIRGKGELTVHDNSHIGSYSIIGVNGVMSIGENCMIADHVTIRDTNHIYQNQLVPMNKQGVTIKNITIDKDVWIGHGSIILQGIHIGKGSVVGAGSVVTKSIDSYHIVAGNPAKMISRR